MASLYALVGVHALLGEFGALCFLWALVEIMNRSEASLARARIASVLGVISLFGMLVAIADPYVAHYGSATKPVILKGPMPWAHALVMETKEHIALFIPIVALCASIALYHARREGTASPAYRYISILCGLVVLMVFCMAGMGYIIATGVRVAVGGGV
jgi:hypothetical protein